MTERGLNSLEHLQFSSIYQFFFEGHGWSRSAASGKLHIFSQVASWDSAHQYWRMCSRLIQRTHHWSSDENSYVSKWEGIFDIEAASPNPDLLLRHWTTIPVIASRIWHVSIYVRQETIAFVTANYPEWSIVGRTIETKGSKTSKLAEIPSLKLISQNLSYATELERIV